jgi:hypothetical protein
MGIPKNLSQSSLIKTREQTHRRQEPIANIDNKEGASNNLFQYGCPVTTGIQNFTN